MKMKILIFEFTHSRLNSSTGPREGGTTGAGAQNPALVWDPVNYVL